MSAGNKPSAVAVAATTNIVSSLEQEPDVMSKMMLKYGHQGAEFFGFVKSLGYVLPIKQTSGSLFTNDWIHETINVSNEVGSVTGGAGAGLAATFRLSHDSPVLDYDGVPVVPAATFSNYDANQNIFVRVNDAVILSNGVHALVTDVTVVGTDDVDVTIVPFRAADDIDAATTLTDDTELMIYSANFAEGTGQPVGVTSKNVREEFFLQIIKDTFTVSGTEANTAKYWKTFGDGKAIPHGSFSKGTVDCDYRMALKMEGSMVWGQVIDNPTILNDADLNPYGGNFGGSEGIWTYAKRCGTNLTTNSPDEVQADIWDRILEREFVGSDVAVFAGIQFSQRFNNNMKDYFANDNNSYTRKVLTDKYFEGKEAYASVVDWSALRKNERNFMIKKFGIFNHPKLGGSHGYRYDEAAIIAPLGKTKAKIGTEEETMPYVGYRYLSNLHNRMMQIWRTGGGGSTGQTDQLDIINYNMRSEGGGFFCCGNKFIVSEGA